MGKDKPTTIQRKIDNISIRLTVQNLGKNKRKKIIRYCLEKYARLYDCSIEQIRKEYDDNHLYYYYFSSVDYHHVQKHEVRANEKKRIKKKPQYDRTTPQRKTAYKTIRQKGLSKIVKGEPIYQDDIGAELLVNHTKQMYVRKLPENPRYIEISKGRSKQYYLFNLDLQDFEYHLLEELPKNLPYPTKARDIRI